MRLANIAVAALVVGLAGCKEKTAIRAPFDAGIACQLHERLVDGNCQFVCERDGDCAAGQRCNLFSGACEPKPPAPDAGVQAFPCTNGAERCAASNKTIEKCGADGTWAVSQTCPPPSGFCLNEHCLTCQPGLATCDPANSRVAKVCLDDGSAFRTINCAGVGVCNSGECRECMPGASRCSVDGKMVQVCKRTTDETLAWAWVNDGDAFDASCITQVCEGSPAHCRAPACFPGTTQCKNIGMQQVCSDTGGWTDQACSTLPGFSSSAECQNGVCVDECADAAKAKSYFGCEYWSAPMDNGMDAKVFKGGVTTGQGIVNNLSEFAYVVSNRSALPTTVTVTRYYSGALQVVATVVVPGRTDATTKGVAVIKVPWQSIGNDSNYYSVSGLARYGYRIKSTRPVTVYQFNPLAAVGGGSACTSVTQCTLQPTNSGQQCVGGKCQYFAYSNDASLLLPAHILGLSYVGMAPEHIMFRETSTPTSTSIAFNGQLVVVGTQDGTTVTIKSNAATLAGGSVGAILKGGTRIVTLNSYDVLQIATDNPVGAASASTNLEACASYYNNRSTCDTIFGPPCMSMCRVENDLTGSIITSDKPIAVFGGSQCTLRPFSKGACDHVEEQLFPFVTWGKKFVGVRTNPLRLVDGTFATAANSGPDFYKIVAGCPSSTCPTGTGITITPAPAAANVLVRAAGATCTPAQLAGNTCRLMGGQFIEFQSKSSFTIEADQPISVAQFFAGQDSTVGSSALNGPSQGDPSQVLLPPVEQWRGNYTVLTAPGIRDNYLGLAIETAKVLRVEVDGAAVPMAGFTAIAGTPYSIKNHPVTVGTHTVNVVPQPGVSPLPGAGLTVYGFDSYVSYGYTGGLDLGAIVTGINPGG